MGWRQYARSSITASRSRRVFCAEPASTSAEDAPEIDRARPPCQSLCMAAAPLFDLTDRAYIVTGAGRGIGAELAAGLAEAGACVAVAGRTAADCETVAGAIAAKGGRAIAAPFDARDEAQCAALIAETERAVGRLDGAVVNHGIGLHRDALDTTRDDFADML